MCGGTRVWSDGLVPLVSWYRTEFCWSRPRCVPLPECTLIAFSPLWAGITVISDSLVPSVCTVYQYHSVHCMSNLRCFGSPPVLYDLLLEPCVPEDIHHRTGHMLAHFYSTCAAVLCHLSALPSQVRVVFTASGGMAMVLARWFGDGLSPASKTMRNGTCMAPVVIGVSGWKECVPFDLSSLWQIIRDVCWPSRYKYSQCISKK